MVLRQRINACIAFAVIATTLSVSSAAAVRTVILEIPTMDCATCPITIRIALLHVQGVMQAQVSYERSEARVSFDDARTNVEALRRATADVGYPSLEKDLLP